MGFGILEIAGAALVALVMGFLGLKAGEVKGKRKGRQEAADEATRDTLRRVQDGIDAQNDGRNSDLSPDDRLRRAHDEFK